MRLKDRRKPWQKECINFTWSLCGTIAKERQGKNWLSWVDKAKQKGLFDDMNYIKWPAIDLDIDNTIETDEQYLDRIRQLLAA